jgi:DNA-binding transcriptional regulator YhcF (GntR family)
MTWHVNTASRLPIYQQLAQQIREAIARGELRPEAGLCSPCGSCRASWS